MGGCGGPSLRDIGGGFLELTIGGFLQAGGGMEADFRHTVGNLDPQERGCLQGVTPSGDVIIHITEGFYFSGHRGGVCPSNYVPLLR